MKKINLKNLLNESTPGYENRKFGDSLPTLDSVQKAYKLKSILEGEDGDGMVCEACGTIHEGECDDMMEHTVNFTKEEMATLHNDGKLVKKDKEGKDHTYLFGESKLTEARDFVVIDPRGNARPVGMKIQGQQYVKKMGGPRKGYHLVLKKNALKARRAIEKNGGNATNTKIQDIMWDLLYEGKDLQEKAPKMKVYSWEKHFNAGQKELDKAANIMSRKSSGGYNNVKKDIMKVQKAINMLRSKMKINSTEF